MAAGSPPAAGRTALVVGGGISGLLAARELAQAGPPRPVLEAADAWGGCVGSHVVAGLTLDSGAESFATRSSAVADLAAELGLAGKIVAPASRRSLGAAAGRSPRTSQDRRPGHPGQPVGPGGPPFPGATRLPPGVAGQAPAGLRGDNGATSRASPRWCGPGWAAASWNGSWRRWWAGCTPPTPAFSTWTWWPRGSARGSARHGSLAAAVAAQRKRAGGAGRSGAGLSRGSRLQRQAPPSPVFRAACTPWSPPWWPTFGDAACSCCPARGPTQWRGPPMAGALRRGRQRTTPTCWWSRSTGPPPSGCLQEAVPALGRPAGPAPGRTSSL